MSPGRPVVLDIADIRYMFHDEDGCNVVIPLKAHDNFSMVNSIVSYKLYGAHM